MWTLNLVFLEGSKMLSADKLNDAFLNEESHLQAAVCAAATQQ